MVMKKLVEKLEELKKSEISETIRNRINEFEQFQKRENKDLFQELSFCLLTANFNAAKSIIIQEEIRGGFLTLEKNELIKKLKEFGHRFPNNRAKYILDARKHISTLKETLKSFENEKELRNWLVNNVKGLGMKESSHFLRNVGYKNLAIIDFHIVDLLVKEDLIGRPKTITKKKYLEIEQVLEKVGKESNLNLAELDLYLWFMETGKVLK